MSLAVAHDGESGAAFVGIPIRWLLFASEMMTQRKIIIRVE